MRRTTRNNIQLAQDQGIRVREGKGEDIAVFYELLKATSQRRKFDIEDKDYYLNLWRLLEPHAHVKLFIAEYEHEALSGMLTIAFGDTVVAKRFGWIGTMRWLRPNELLFWKAMEWSSANGYHFFDLDGIDVSAAIALLQGECLPRFLRYSDTRFKLGLGGCAVLLPSTYEFVSNRTLGLLLETSSSLLGIARCKHCSDVSSPTDDHGTSAQANLVAGAIECTTQYQKEKRRRPLGIRATTNFTLAHRQGAGQLCLAHFNT